MNRRVATWDDGRLSHNSATLAGLTSAVWILRYISDIIATSSSVVTALNIYRPRKEVHHLTTKMGSPSSRQ